MRVNTRVRRLASYSGCHSDADLSGDQGDLDLSEGGPNRNDLMYNVHKLQEYSEDELWRAVAEFRLALFLEAFDIQQKATDSSLSSSLRQTEVKKFRDRWLGRKSGLFGQTNELWLKNAPANWKKLVGQVVNRLRQIDQGEIEKMLERQDYFASRSPVEIQAINRMFNEQRFEQERRRFHDRWNSTKKALRNLRALDTQEVRKIAGEQLGLDLSDAVPGISDELKTLSIPSHSAAERVDITLPGVRRPMGAEHPVIRTMNEIVGVFRNLGYSVSEGPEVETDYYNFEALNFPPNHPARDMQDTLFLAGQDQKAQRERLLLRTHTSPVQIRTMEKRKPPLRIVIPGKVYRNDPPDASHSPMFHQIEGLAVDTNITFGDLKGTLDHAMKALFGSSVKTQFRPSFFPFTEPSAEMMVSCFICGGSGKRESEPCRPCKTTGWIEILGCGMVDPNVFEFVKHNGYDPKKVSGFAFGMGVDRIAILKYGVDDIQLFFQGDVRFLQQFG
jgi:phenylalanyl-tRNA synthetase alpha chain